MKRDTKHATTKFIFLSGYVNGCMANIALDLGDLIIFYRLADYWTHSAPDTTCTSQTQWIFTQTIQQTCYPILDATL